MSVVEDQSQNEKSCPNKDEAVLVSRVVSQEEFLSCMEAKSKPKTKPQPKPQSRKPKDETITADTIREKAGDGVLKAITKRGTCIMPKEQLKRLDKIAAESVLLHMFLTSSMPPEDYSYTVSNLIDQMERLHESTASERERFGVADRTTPAKIISEALRKSLSDK